MYRTFDEFLRLTWGDEHWQVSTRAVYQSSRNDYKYRNRDKKENIYDEEMNIVGSYYPVERNKSGAFDDVHVLQEIYYNTGRGDRFRTECLVYQLEPRTAAADDRLRRRHPVREPPAGAHAPQRPLVGPPAPRLEGRREGRIHPYMDGLRLPPRPGQRHHDLHDPLPKQDRHLLRAGGGRIRRGRRVALHGRHRAAPALRPERRQEHRPAAGRQGDRGLRPEARRDRRRRVGQMAARGAARPVGRPARTNSTARNGPRFRPSSPTTCSRSAATSWRKPPCRATSASRR